MPADGSAACRFWVLMHSSRWGPIVAELTDTIDPRKLAFFEREGYEVIDRQRNPLPPQPPKVVGRV